MNVTCPITDVLFMDAQDFGWCAPQLAETESSSRAEIVIRYVN